MKLVSICDANHLVKLFTLLEQTDLFKERFPDWEELNELQKYVIEEVNDKILYLQYFKGEMKKDE